MNKFPITKNGLVKLEEELKNLKHVERPAITVQIAEAREHGDLSENAEYHAAREKQGFIEAKIADLEDKLSRSEVIDYQSFSTDNVKFGAQVKIIDDNTEEEFVYIIQGEYEADIANNIISIKTPIARALIGKEEGDIVEVATPKGTKTFEILSINYKY